MIGAPRASQSGDCRFVANRTWTSDCLVQHCIPIHYDTVRTEHVTTAPGRHLPHRPRPSQPVCPSHPRPHGPPHPHSVAQQASNSRSGVLLSGAVSSTTINMPNCSRTARRACAPGANHRLALLRSRGVERRKGHGDEIGGDYSRQRVLPSLVRCRDVRYLERRARFESGAGRVAGDWWPVTGRGPATVDDQNGENKDDAPPESTLARRCGRDKKRRRTGPGARDRRAGQWRHSERVCTREAASQ